LRFSFLVFPSFLLACQNSHFEIVQWLIEKQNANINDTDYQNCTPIHYASASGSEDIIYYLLEKNAKIISDNSGNTPLHTVSNKTEYLKIDYL
jgi:ankyrin repeat protein